MELILKTLINVADLLKYFKQKAEDILVTIIATAIKKLVSYIEWQCIHQIIYLLLFICQTLYVFQFAQMFPKSFINIICFFQKQKQENGSPATFVKILLMQKKQTFIKCILGKQREEHSQKSIKAWKSCVSTYVFSKCCCRLFGLNCHLESPDNCISLLNIIIEKYNYKENKLLTELNLFSFLKNALKSSKEAF